MIVGNSGGYRQRPAPQEPLRPELADVGLLARRLVTRTVAAARADEAESVASVVADHLGPDSGGLPVAKASWPAYDRVNVQVGLEAWLAQPGRQHRLLGLTDYRHSDFGFADLFSGQLWGHHVSLGSVETEALPAAPGGVTRPCVQCGVYLTADSTGSSAILLRGPESHGMRAGVTIEVVSPAPDRATGITEEIRKLALQHNVFRGHVISFGGEVFGDEGSGLLSFVDRPQVGREQVILPDDVLDGIERQVLGVARHTARLRASGQHLRRGVLLYGVPGTGKTHTMRYLLGRLPGVTCVILSGSALGMIGAACSVARVLEPSVIVVEDVDLIAEDRDYGGENTRLFELLNEMDGLGADADVTFLLTTNRADLLEAALAARPGRVDHAVEMRVPDAEARLRLLRLYRGGLDLKLSDATPVIERTEGVTASFIKELLRRAAVVAAEADAAAGHTDDAAPIRVTDEHLAAALDQLLDVRNALTHALLGGRPDKRRQEARSAAASSADPDLPDDDPS